MSADFSFPALPGLTPADREALEAACHPQMFRRGENLREGHVLFVDAGLFAVDATQADGVLAELVGPGGAAGLAEMLAEQPAGPCAVALTEAAGWAIEAGRLRQLAEAGPGIALALATLLARSLAATRETLACAALHRIDQRWARLMLQLHDRMGETVVITHDELARMLAVQRTSVTSLAHRMKAAGLVTYLRGRIRIVDAERLRALAEGGAV